MDLHLREAQPHQGFSPDSCFGGSSAPRASRPSTPPHRPPPQLPASAELTTVVGFPVPSRQGFCCPLAVIGHTIPSPFSYFPTQPFFTLESLGVGVGGAAVVTVPPLLRCSVSPRPPFLVPSKSSLLLVPKFQIPFNIKKFGEGFFKKLQHFFPM